VYPLLKKIKLGSIEHNEKLNDTCEPKSFRTEPTFSSDRNIQSALTPVPESHKPVTDVLIHNNTAATVEVIHDDCNDEMLGVGLLPSLCHEDVSKPVWIKDLGLSLNSKTDIESGKWLSTDQINAAMKLLQREFPNMYGLQDCGKHLPVRIKGKWAYEFQFDSVPDDVYAVQIHYANSHFTTSAKLPNNPIIYHMDSMNSSSLDEVLAIQLSSLYGKPYTDLQVVQYPTQQQKPSLGNCGLFAIANALEFCLNNRYKEAEYHYDEDKMRPHLVSCFQNNRLVQFPHSSRVRQASRLSIKRKRRQKTHEFRIPINCACALSDAFEDMVMCDSSVVESCQKWFHYTCVNLDQTPNVTTWCCPKCDNNAT
jgi:hypothetical protein